MIKFDERLYEILLVCNYKGSIKRILYNSLKFDAFPILGQSLMNICEETSKANLLNCLHTTINFHQSNKCEVNFIVGKKRYLMVLAAKKLDSDNLLIGMISTLQSMNMYEEMMKINNESINELRRLAKERGIEGNKKQIVVESSQEESVFLHSISMNNYLDIIKNDSNEFVYVLKNIINMSNYFASYKNIEIKLKSEVFISCIKYKESLVNEVLNSLLSIILKYTIIDSTILISISQLQEFIVLDIEFKSSQSMNKILNDKGYLFIQGVVENDKSMIWYEENDDKIKIYLVDKMIL